MAPSNYPLIHYSWKVQCYFQCFPLLRHCLLPISSFSILIMSYLVQPLRTSLRRLINDKASTHRLLSQFYFPLNSMLDTQLTYLFT